MESNPLLCKCGLCTVTSFQRGQYGKGGGVTFQCRHLSSTTSARGPRSTPAVMSHVDSRHPEMKDETALHRWSSSQHPAPQCNREKNTRQVPTEGDSTKSLATVLKPVKGIENKESLRNCHSPEEPEET